MEGSEEAGCARWRIIRFGAKGEIEQALLMWRTAKLQQDVHRRLGIIRQESRLDFRWLWNRSIGKIVQAIPVCRFWRKIRMWVEERFSAYFFVFALISFIGVSQHTGTHVGSHPHGSSITITSPHSSHLYFVPFFAINLHLLVVYCTKISCFPWIWNYLLGSLRLWERLNEHSPTGLCCVWMFRGRIRHWKLPLRNLSALQRSTMYAFWSCDVWYQCVLAWVFVGALAS